MTENSDQSPIRRHIIRIRFNDAEMSKLAEIETRTGFDKCKILRDHLGRIKVFDKELAKNRMTILARLNSNVNQIAKWVNTHKGGADASRVIKELILLRAKIDELTAREAIDAD